MPSVWQKLYAERLVRLIAYGGTSLILVLYLSSLGVSEERIGLFMTLTLLGDVVISLVLTIIADSIGRRWTLAFGALLMTASGTVFATCSKYWILVLASVLGVISPGGNEIGPFKAIEESTISHLVPVTDRSSVFAWYILLGTIGTAIGTVMAGWIVQALQRHQGWKAQDAYRTVFWTYAALGLVKFVLVLMLGPDCEQEKKTTPTPATQEETQPLLAGRVGADGKDVKASSLSLKSLLPTISRESSNIVFKLCLLFAIDSIASGIVPGSWISYFFNRKFSLAEGTIGTLFFASMLIASASNLAVPSLARRIGLIRTMVFTHVPASIALALIPLPKNAIAAMSLFLFRACTNSMDQPPRQAFIAGAVLAEERTAVMGVVNVVKTLSQSFGPIFTGVLAGKQKMGLAFVIAGGLKLLYDALMLAIFLGYRTREEQAAVHVDLLVEALPADTEEMANRSVSQHIAAVV